MSGLRQRLLDLRARRLAALRLDSAPEEESESGSSSDSSSDSSTVHGTIFRPSQVIYPVSCSDSSDDVSSTTRSDTADDSYDDDSSTIETVSADDVVDTADHTAAGNNHGFSFPTIGPVPLDNSIEWIIYHEEAIQRVARCYKWIQQRGNVQVTHKDRQRVARLQRSIRAERAEYEAEQKRKASLKDRVTKPAQRVARKAPMTSQSKKARDSWEGRVAEEVSKEEAIKEWAEKVADKVY